MVKQTYIGDIAFCYKQCGLNGANHPGTYNWFDKCASDCSLYHGFPTSDWTHTLGLCWKKMYDRGVGTLPDKCADTAKEMFEGLCYTKCPPGLSATSWSPCTCSQPCPPNTEEGGFANCTKINSYGRGAGDQGNGCDPGYDNMGLYCYRWWLPDGKGFNCRNACDVTPWEYYSPVDWSVPYFYGCQFGSGYKLKPPLTCKNLNEIVNPNTGQTGQISDPWYNTVQANRNDNNCEENWGSFCYPRCDVGFNSFGCCVCSPSCGNLRDDGATCHREWSNRGAGTVPDGCSDPNRIYDELLCYHKCQDGYNAFATTCTRDGCPDGTVPSSALACATQLFDNSDGSMFAIPNVSDTINSTFNMAQLGDSVRQVILNGIVILGCALLVVFALAFNITLRSKKLT